MGTVVQMSPRWIDVGIGIAVPSTAKPHIQADHIDGPLLVMRSGELHWLTLWERFQFMLGRADAFSLERKHRPLLPGLFGD